MASDRDSQSFAQADMGFHHEEDPTITHLTNPAAAARPHHHKRSQQRAQQGSNPAIIDHALGLMDGVTAGADASATNTTNITDQSLCGPSNKYTLQYQIPVVESEFVVYQYADRSVLTSNLSIYIILLVVWTLLYVFLIESVPLAFIILASLVAVFSIVLYIAVKMLQKQAEALQQRAMNPEAENTNNTNGKKRNSAQTNAASRATNMESKKDTAVGGVQVSNFFSVDDEIRLQLRRNAFIHEILTFVGHLVGCLFTIALVATLPECIDAKRDPHTGELQCKHAIHSDMMIALLFSVWASKRPPRVPYFTVELVLLTLINLLPRIISVGFPSDWQHYVVANFIIVVVAMGSVVTAWIVEKQTRRNFDRYVQEFFRVAASAWVKRQTEAALAAQVPLGMGRTAAINDVDGIWGMSTQQSVCCVGIQDYASWAASNSPYEVGGLLRKVVEACDEARVASGTLAPRYHFIGDLYMIGGALGNSPTTSKRNSNSNDDVMPALQAIMRFAALSVVHAQEALAVGLSMLPTEGLAARPTVRVAMGVGVGCSATLWGARSVVLAGPSVDATLDLLQVRTLALTGRVGVIIDLTTGEKTARFGSPPSSTNVAHNHTHDPHHHRTMGDSQPDPNAAEGGEGAQPRTRDSSRRESTFFGYQNSVSNPDDDLQNPSVLVTKDFLAFFWKHQEHEQERQEQQKSHKKNNREPKTSRDGGGAAMNVIGPQYSSLTVVGVDSTTNAPSPPNLLVMRAMGGGTNHNPNAVSLPREFYQDDNCIPFFAHIELPNITDDSGQIPDVLFVGVEPQKKERAPFHPQINHHYPNTHPLQQHQHPQSQGPNSSTHAFEGANSTATAYMTSATSSNSAKGILYGSTAAGGPAASDCLGQSSWGSSGGGDGGAAAGLVMVGPNGSTMFRDHSSHQQNHRSSTAGGNNNSVVLLAKVPGGRRSSARGGGGGGSSSAARNPFVRNNSVRTLETQPQEEQHEESDEADDEGIIAVSSSGQLQQQQTTHNPIAEVTKLTDGMAARFEDDAVEAEYTEWIRGPFDYPRTFASSVLSVCTSIMLVVCIVIYEELRVFHADSPLPYALCSLVAAFVQVGLLKYVGMVAESKKIDATLSEREFEALMPKKMIITLLSLFFLAFYVIAVALAPAGNALANSLFAWVIPLQPVRQCSARWYHPLWMWMPGCLYCIVLAIIGIVRPVGTDYAVWTSVITLLVGTTTSFRIQLVIDQYHREEFAAVLRAKHFHNQLEQDYHSLEEVMNKIAPKGIAAALVKTARDDAVADAKAHDIALGGNQSYRDEAAATTTVAAQPTMARGKTFGRVIQRMRGVAVFEQSRLLITHATPVYFAYIQLQHVHNMLGTSAPLLVEKLRHALRPVLQGHRQTTQLLCKDRYKSLEILKANADTILIVVGEPDSSMLAVKMLFLFAMELSGRLRAIDKLRHRMLLGCGASLGGVFGSSSVSFEYYGAQMSVGHAMLLAAPMGHTVALTSGFSHTAIGSWFDGWSPEEDSDGGITLNVAETLEPHLLDDKKKKEEAEAEKNAPEGGAGSSSNRTSTTVERFVGSTTTPVAQQQPPNRSTASPQANSGSNSGNPQVHQQQLLQQHANEQQQEAEDLMASRLQGGYIGAPQRWQVVGIPPCHVRLVSLIIDVNKLPEHTFSRVLKGGVPTAATTNTTDVDAVDVSPSPTV